MQFYIAVGVILQTNRRQTNVFTLKTVSGYRQTNLITLVTTLKSICNNKVLIDYTQC